MTRAQKITAAVVELRTGEAECFEPIVVTVMDGADVRCLTEAMLDTWWANLPAGQKATIYERDLEGDPVELFLRGSLGDVVDHIQGFAQEFEAALTGEPFVLMRGAPLRKQHTLEAGV